MTQEDEDDDEEALNGEAVLPASVHLQQMCCLRTTGILAAVHLSQSMQTLQRTQFGDVPNKLQNLAVRITIFKMRHALGWLEDQFITMTSGTVGCGYSWLPGCVRSVNASMGGHGGHSAVYVGELNIANFERLVVAAADA
eukprot:5248548-Amphidinium_carterae.1